MSQSINTLIYQFACNKCIKYCEFKCSVQAEKITENGERLFECKKCSKCFSKLFDFCNHYRLHLSAELLICQECQKKFGPSSAANIPNKESKEAATLCRTRFECELCHKHLSGLTALKEHRRTHTGERPFACDVCQKPFFALRHVKIHMSRVHTTDRPFQCEMCGKRFKCIYSHNVHLKTHSGIKPHKCDVCYKCFKTARYLKSHKVIHTGERAYECDVCKETFTFLKCLNKHKSVHTGERPFECDVCLQHFRLSKILNAHKIIHSGEKPFKCEVCGMRFTQSSSKIRHKRRKHSGK